MKNFKNRAFGVCMIALVAAAGSASAQTWSEVGEAGDLPGTANITSGAGPLSLITGRASDGLDVDMFCIRIDDWSTFSATLTGSADAGGAIDTQLYLFDMAGGGIAFNDDAPFPFSVLDAGNPIYSSRAAGELVFIAVSQYNVDPHNGAFFMFPNTFSGVHGPVAPGPVVGWQGNGGEAGTYTIELTGASYHVPTPGVAAVLGLGGLMAGRRRRAVA